jgi:hypothetical protein
MAVEAYDTGGTVWDSPNKEVLGLDPPWVEGDGYEGTPAAEGLDGMTKAELLDHAKSIGASPANESMTKDELRESIDRKEAEG